MTETKQLEKQETVSNENDAFASKALFSNIIPLGESCDEQSLPDFPVDVLNVLPPDIAKFITEISRIKHVPRSMMGVSVLSVLEIACRGRYPICLSDGYRERPCLYIVPIAGSGECKSSVESVVMKPLDDFEQDYNNEHRAEINKSIGIKKSLEEAFAKAQKEYTKSLLDTNPDKSCAAESLFLHMTRLLTDFEPVTELRLYGSDSTPEKLAQLLKEQGGTFAFVSDEGAEIIGNMGRYNDKGDGGLSVYLKGYSGGTISGRACTAGTRN
ncbi:hypothetical protein FACS1894120_6640 [Clostridia bacterium]|nr:hypothetical protein FACS1894120_6640 [Clostridia bacterium]